MYPLEAKEEGGGEKLREEIAILNLSPPVSALRQHLVQVDVQASN